MKAHDLAKLLLSMPDIPVITVEWDGSYQAVEQAIEFSERDEAMISLQGASF